jgi:hypothetical protein
VAGFEIGRAVRARSSLQTIAADWATAAAQAIPAAVLFLLTAGLSDLSFGPSLTSYGSIEGKIVALESPIIFLGGRMEHLIAGLIVVGTVIGLLSGRLRMAAQIWPSALAVAVVAIFIPEWVMSVWGLDLRLPLVAVLILVASFSLRLPPSLTPIFIAGLIAVTGLKAYIEASALQVVDGQIAEVKRVVAQLPTGSRVLPVEIEGRVGPLTRGPWRMTSQISLLTVIDRDSFVPFSTNWEV